MESTGVYWKPVWNVLEKTLRLVLANPYQIKNIPSQKTDRRDSVWIADLLAHGLIKPSFVPPPEIRQLRDLTRPAGAGDWLADYARGSLRGKREELELVLRGHLTEHHCYLWAELMAGLEFLESWLARLDQQLNACMQPFAEQVERLCGIPGVDLLTAWTLIAELGVDMSVFPDAVHVARWAGLCPGNRWIRRALSSVGLGGDAQTQLSFDGAVLPADGSLGGEEGDCGCGCGSPDSNDGLFDPTGGNQVARIGWGFL